MNIWTQLLSLNGHPLDGELISSTSQSADAGHARPASQHEDRDQETEAARRAIPLWRPSPGVAIR